MTLTVRTITAAEHRAYIASQPTIALQQTPGWGRGFVAARTESVGWFEGHTMLGAGLFRYRGLPRLPMRSVAVFEIGPDIDWPGRRRPQLGLDAWTRPLVEHLRDRGVFTVRINPPVVRRDWYGVDPSQRSESNELVLHQGEAIRSEARTALERLRAAGWKPLSGADATFSAELRLADGTPAPRATPRDSTALLRGYTTRIGTPEDLLPVRDAVAAAHPGIPIPSAEELHHRWEGLASDNLAGVQLVVVEHDQNLVYGGLVAIVGARAYDLSLPLPQPDADRPEVQAMRAKMVATARAAGAQALTVPTVTSDRRAPVESPAPGWPPVHLSEQLGIWQFPVRASWHSALAPIVDRLVL